MALSFKPGRGFKPNHPSRKAKSIFLHAGLSEILSSSEPIPDVVDNSAYLCPVLNQIETSECVAHAHAEGIFASLKAKGTPLPWVPSPTGIYQVANGLQRAAYSPGIAIEDLPPLQDNGLEPHFAQQAVRIGIVKTRSADGLSDADPSTAAQEADPVTFTEGALKCVLGVNLLDVLDSMRIDTLCRLLAAKKFVSFALFADYAAFMGYGPTSSPLGAPPPNSGSDHDVLLVDYVTDSDGQRIFRVQNSWSTGWGYAGFFHALESNAMTWTDLEVIDATIGGAS